MTQDVELTGAAPVLVAHRGYSGRYPENTLLAFQAAHQHGAQYMELDLQMTSDLVPFLHHDQSLLRMAGIDVDIRECKAKLVKAMHAAYEQRFEQEFSDNEFTSFKKFCRWLKRHPEVTVFVELKQESLERFGTPVFVDEVYKRIIKTGVESQCVIISFNEEAIEYARKISPMRVGWVLPKWNEETHAKANEMKPDFLFCDTMILPDEGEDIWQGPWQWAVYNLDDVPAAIELANRGIPFLETNQIGTLMAHDALANRV